MDGIWQDFRYALRMLLKRPGFTAVAIFSLTLGVGANTTIFTLMNALFLHSIPVQDPSQVIMVLSNQHMSDGTVRDFLGYSYLNADDIRQNVNAFTGLSMTWGTGANLDLQGKQIGVGVQLVNWNYFDILGVRPVAGRGFIPEEDQTPGARPVVVISYGLWQRQFGGERSILGSAIRLNNVDYAVVGVAPPEFRNAGFLGSPDVWAPMMMHIQMVTDTTKDWYLKRAPRMINMVGRLKPGMTMRQAQEATQVVWSQLQHEYPKDNGGKGVTLIPVSETNIPPQVRSVFVLAGVMLSVVVGFVLLIACGNVANLLLARATQRRRELAVRLSLGASRGRLLRQLLTESLMLGLTAGGLGIVTAIWGRDLLRAELPAGITQNLDLRLDLRVLFYAVGISVVATLLFGLIPALQASKSNQMGSLRDRTDAPSSVGRWYGLRGILVMVQVALSLVALTGAGLFIHSLRNAQQMDPGFETKHELLAFVSFGQQHYTQAQAEQSIQAISDRVRALPMVKSAAFSTTAPLNPNIAYTFSVEGSDASDPRSAKIAAATMTQPGYFASLNIPMVEGRDFTDHDDMSGQKVIIVNKALADSCWPGQDPVGKRLNFLILPEPYTVVGLVKTVKTVTLGEPPAPVVYFPLKQQYQPGLTLNVLVNGTPDGAAASVSKAISAADANLRLPRTADVAQLLEQTLQPQKVEAELLGGFGFLALVLAAIGTYGVMSYSVSQRTQEIGIRMALGAQPRDVLRLMLGSGMPMVLGGVAAALALTLLLTHSLNALLFGIGVFDPASFVVMAALMIIVALVACWIPSQRAMRVSPVIALRYD